MCNACQDTYERMSLAALFIMAQKWKLPKYPSNDDGRINKCGGSTQWNIIHPSPKSYEVVMHAAAWRSLENTM